MAELMSKLSLGTIPAVFHDMYKPEYGPLTFQILAVKPLDNDNHVPTARLKVRATTYYSGRPKIHQIVYIFQTNKKITVAAKS